MTIERDAKFMVGEVVSHQLFGYRGVIVDADPVFVGSDDWYQDVARTRPPKDMPWYRVLVHGGQHETYVAERNLAADTSGRGIDHPQLPFVFDRFVRGRYEQVTRVVN